MGAIAEQFGQRCREEGGSHARRFCLSQLWKEKNSIDGAIYLQKEIKLIMQTTLSNKSVNAREIYNANRKVCERWSKEKNKMLNGKRTFLL